MATITCFEDLEIWQLAREIFKNVNTLIKENRFKNDFSLTVQIRRSSGSAMDNIAEGFERNGNKEFINFRSYSKASAGECRSQLYRALDYNYINENEFNHLKEKSIELSVKIKKFMEYLKNSEFRGSKFK